MTENVRTGLGITLVGIVLVLIGTLGESQVFFVVGVIAAIFGLLTTAAGLVRNN